MFSSEAISRDMMGRNASFLSPSNTFNKHHTGDEQQQQHFMAGADLFLNQNPHQNQHQQQQGGSGLARYRSAPSSFLAALLDSSNTDNSSSGDESEALFTAFMNGPGPGGPARDLKQEVGAEPEPRPGGYESAVSVGGGAIVGSYSVGMESQVNMNLRVSGNSNSGSSTGLARQSSSPAGFFNGFGVMGEVGNYRVHNSNPNSSGSAMSNHMNFSSGPSSSSRFMPSIPEDANESMGPRNPEIRNGDNANNGREFDSIFPRESWNDSPFNNGLKRNRDGDAKMFSDFNNGLDNQNGKSIKKSSPGLVHHMSLPKTSAEMAEVEKYLQFQQDTAVPCQVRAKRGCATHPRSIAERMRRTRISEKMKKLQDLFPNIDKQTSTADMLDSAVEYIKDLQKQVQTLADMKAKCVCSNKPQQASPDR